MDERGLMMYVLQTVGALVLAVTTGIAGWALKEVYRLSRDFEGLRVRVQAEGEHTIREFQRLQDWMRAIDGKLAKLMTTGCGDRRHHEPPD